MRNILITAFLAAVLSLSFITEALAVGPEATLVTCSEKQVGANTRYICTIPTVAASDSKVFKVPTLKTAGKIDEMYFAPASSTDCDIWLSGLDNSAFSEAPVYHITGIDTDGVTPEIKKRDYVNMDTVQIKFQYFTVDNQDAVNATGESILIHDFVRN